MNNKNRLLLIIAVGVLIIGTAYFGLKTYSLSKELALSQAEAAAVHKNEKIILFSRLFIEKVLNADKEVDFETRLQLENAVRDLKDGEVLSGWQKFIGSKTEAQAQTEVKNLLRLLISKAIISN